MLQCTIIAVDTTLRTVTNLPWKMNLKKYWRKFLNYKCWHLFPRMYVCVYALNDSCNSNPSTNLKPFGVLFLAIPPAFANERGKEISLQRIICHPIIIFHRKRTSLCLQWVVDEFHSTIYKKEYDRHRLPPYCKAHRQMVAPYQPFVGKTENFYACLEGG